MLSHLQAARCVNNDGIKVLCLCLFQALPCDVHWPGIRSQVKHRDGDFPAHEAQLLDGCRPVEGRKDYPKP